MLSHIFWTPGGYHRSFDLSVVSYSGVRMLAHLTESHRVEATQDCYFRTFLLRCLSQVSCRGGFNRPFPSPAAAKSHVCRFMFFIAVLRSFTLFLVDRFKASCFSAKIVSSLLMSSTCAAGLLVLFSLRSDCPSHSQLPARFGFPPFFLSNQLEDNMALLDVVTQGTPDGGQPCYLFCVQFCRG